MSSQYQELAQDLLHKAKRKGASEGDVVVVEAESSDVQVRMGAIDNIK